MTVQHKTNIIAAWIVLSGLVSTLIILLAGGHLNMAKESLSISISVVTAFALIKRANWARWLIGVGATLGLSISFYSLFQRQVFGRAILSWAGIWFILAVVFSVWIVYTTFFDKQFVAYSKQKSTQHKIEEKTAEPQR